MKQYRFKSIDPQTLEEVTTVIPENELTEVQQKLLLNELVNHYKASPQIVKTAFTRMIKKNILLLK